MSDRDRTIDETMAALIKGMLFRGDDHRDVAAFFLINQGRCADLFSGRRFPEVKLAKPERLPPPIEQSFYELWMAGKWP